MKDSTLTWNRHIIDLKSHNYSEYIEEEANAFYHLEDCYLTNVLMLNNNFQKQIKSLKKYQYKMAGLKNITKPIFDYFQIHDVKIKKSHSRDGDSYYTMQNQTIYLHQHLFDALNDETSAHNAYEELLYVLYHEIAHAVTDKFFTMSFQHDSNYIYSLLTIFSVIMDENIENLIHDLINNEYYKSQVFWVDKYNHLKFELKKSSDVQNEIKDIQESFKDNYYVSLNGNFDVSENVDVFLFTDDDEVVKVFEYNSQTINDNESLVAYISFNDFVLNELNKINRLTA